MSNEDAMAGGMAAGGRSRQPRQGVGGSPVGSTLSIVLAVVAVVAGFLILRNITDDGDETAAGAPGVEAPDGGDDEPIDSALPVDSSSTTTTTTTLAPTRVGARVIVANASGIGGSAGRMSKALETAGYETVEPTNATGERLEVSIVYFDPTVAAAQEVAASLALDMGGVEVAAVPTPVPTESASLNAAGVLLMLGSAEADVPIAELQARATTTETGAAPDPAGATDPDATDETGATDSEPVTT